MAGDSAIWRATSLGAEASNSSDVIEFNSGTLPDNNSGITQTEIDGSSAIASNEKPKQDIDELQDGGAEGITVNVTGHIKDPTNELASHLIKTWLLEAKTNSTFPKGRFGLRLNDFPSFDVTPTADRGYMLESFAFIREGNTKGKVGFVIVLRFNGGIGTPNGSGQYIW